jgi:hypothetical protein
METIKNTTDPIAHTANTDAEFEELFGSGADLQDWLDWLDGILK